MPKHEIKEWIDVYPVRRATKLLAAQIGFSSVECNELAIVVSELVSNIVKYGVRGSIELERFTNSEGVGIIFVARDFGPPFHDLEKAMLDGYDDRGPIDPMQMLGRRGIGGGLGAVVRLTHTFALEPLDEGKQIRVTRFVNRGLANRFGNWRRS